MQALSTPDQALHRPGSSTNEAITINNPSPGACCSPCTGSLQHEVCVREPTGKAAVEQKAGRLSLPFGSISSSFPDSRVRRGGWEHPLARWRREGGSRRWQWQLCMSRRGRDRSSGGQAAAAERTPAPALPHRSRTAQPLASARCSQEGSGCWCPGMAWSPARSPPLVLALPALRGAALGGLAHPTTGPGDAFLSLLLFQASSVAVPGCLLSETCLEWTQPTQRAAPQRQAVSKRAACVRAALSCETTAPCRAWDGTSGALTTFQLGSAPSLPEIPLGDSIALYSPSELLRSPFDGRW